MLAIFPSKQGSDFFFGAICAGIYTIMWNSINAYHTELENQEVNKTKQKYNRTKTNSLGIFYCLKIRIKFMKEKGSMCVCLFYISIWFLCFKQNIFIFSSFFL
jgi:flagellar motor switch protein FliM